MAGIETALMIASTALGTASSISQASQQRKAQAHAQALQDQQAQQQITELQRQQVRAERDRRERLNRAMASQRAAFAGSGISSDGSGDAVFDNLLTHSLREKQEMDEQMDRTMRNLQDGIQLNLLRRPKADPFARASSMLQSGVSIFNSGRQLGIF